MDTFSDVLARLKFDRGQWETTIRTPCWPEPIDVRITADEAGLTPYQKRVLELILGHSNNLKELVEEPIFQSCVEFAGETFETLDDDCNFVEFEFPTLSRPSDIWPLIDNPAIDIPENADGDQIKFEIVFYREWDLEHCSLHVRFCDFEVVEVD
jgi:hypothetical protein